MATTRKKNTPLRREKTTATPIEPDEEQLSDEPEDTDAYEDDDEAYDPTETVQAEDEDDEPEEPDVSPDDVEPDPSGVLNEAPEGTPGFVQQRYPGMPRSGIVLAPADPVYVKGVVIDRNVHLTTPVYRAFMPHNSQRWMFRQLYGQGAVVPISQVQVLPDEN